MESFGSKHPEHYDDIDPLDYQEAPFYSLLKKMPPELTKRHLNAIEQEGMDDEEATAYLTAIIEQRKEAMTVSVISDPLAQEMFAGHEAELFAHIEKDAYESMENLLGQGMTARVKRYNLSNEERTIPMALKYLVTPNARTLSASGEHDMIREVERIQKIEELERDMSFNYIGVPHPYFHHKNQHIQCYGMQLIDGCDLNKTVANIQHRINMTQFREKLAEVDIKVLEQEIDVFFERMHTYCLHGDIKPRNIMVDTNGKFYLIDFGQSALVNDIPDVGRDQFEVICDEEVKATKTAIRSFIQSVLSTVDVA